MKRKLVTINDKKIGDSENVKFIAELGVNHLGDFDRAIKMIDSAHKAGADFLKFQTYISEKRYDPKKNPKAKEFISNLKKWEFDRNKDKEIWDYARKIGATVFTSPFDLDSLEFSEEMGSSAYKIAAFEMNNLKLLKEVIK